MDSRNTDESRDRLRVETLARRFGEAMDRLSPADAHDCPDAELIAAYSELALASDERAQWEAHFAQCGRCRKILAVLATSSNTPLAEEEVARLGQLVSAAESGAFRNVGSAKAPSPVSASPSLVPSLLTGRQESPTPFRVVVPKKHVKWIAPALGIAAVLAVWLAMKAPWRASPETLVAQAPRSEVPVRSESPAANPAPNSGSQNGEAANVLAGSAASSTNFAPGAASGSPARQNRADADADANAAKSISRLSKKEPLPIIRPPTPPDPRQNATFADRRSAAPPALPDSVNASATANAIQEQAVVDGTAADKFSPTVPPAPPPKSASSELQGRVAQEASSQPAREMKDSVQSSNKARPMQLDSSAKTDGRAGLFTITPPGSGYVVGGAGYATYWRAGKSGHIDRSNDGGRTWHAQKSPVQDDWLSGVCTSTTTCWLTGRNGAIARTTDGENWERIVSPKLGSDPAGTRADWIGVTAQNPEAATITASGGRRFSTQDGGQTWEPQ